MKENLRFPQIILHELKHIAAPPDNTGNAAGTKIDEEVSTWDRSPGQSEYGPKTRNAFALRHLVVNIFLLLPPPFRGLKI